MVDSKLSQQRWQDPRCKTCNSDAAPPILGGCFVFCSVNCRAHHTGIEQAHRLTGIIERGGGASHMCIFEATLLLNGLTRLTPIHPDLPTCANCWGLVPRGQRQCPYCGGEKLTNA